MEISNANDMIDELRQPGCVSLSAYVIDSCPIPKISPKRLNFTRNVPLHSAFFPYIV